MTNDRLFGNHKSFGYDQHSNWPDKLSFIDYRTTHRTYPIRFMLFHIGGTTTWAGWSISIGGICFFCFHNQAICHKYNSIPIWRIIIKGIPYLNFLCIVLWCHIFIPSHAPMLPPKTASSSKVDSGIRHRSFLAFHLSMPYKKNVITLRIAIDV